MLSQEINKGGCFVSVKTRISDDVQSVANLGDLLASWTGLCATTQIIPGKISPFDSLLSVFSP